MVFRLENSATGGVSTSGERKVLLGILIARSGGGLAEVYREAVLFCISGGKSKSVMSRDGRLWALFRSSSLEGGVGTPGFSFGSMTKRLSV